MFTFLGVLLLLAAILTLILKAIATEGAEGTIEQDRWGNSKKIGYKTPFLPFLLNWNKKICYLFIGIAVFFIMIPYMFFFAERGHNYLLVFPTGKMSAVVQQGIKWRGFAKIDKWQKYIDVKVVSDETESDESELEGVMTPIPIRFIDQVTAKGHVSLRFMLPEDIESFVNLAVKYRTMSNLVNNTIIPTVREQLINTGYMFAAQNYISGESQSFRQTFEDQLKGGTFSVEKIETKDTIYSEIESKNKSRRIKEIQTRYTVRKTLVNGIPKRTPHELSENNIVVSQVIVDKIDLEPTFKKRLEAQRDESAKRQLQQQMIETAKAEQQRVVAQGERDKAQERVTQEKEQVKVLIAIETKLKQEATNKELAAIQLETERINSTKRKVKADADAYEIRKKVVAGITPETRLQMELDAGVERAKYMSKIFENVQYISGGGTNGSSGLEELVKVSMSQQILGKTKPKK